jgi:hypothetical protein
MNIIVWFIGYPIGLIVGLWIFDTIERKMRYARIDREMKERYAWAYLKRN